MSLSKMSPPGFPPLEPSWVAGAAGWLSPKRRLDFLEGGIPPAEEGPEGWWQRSGRPRRRTCSGQERGTNGEDGLKVEEDPFIETEKHDWVKVI